MSGFGRCDMTYPKANGRFPPVYPLELMQGCVLNLDMQDMGDKLIDHSGLNNHGTNSGSAVVSKPYGFTRSFNGVDNFITIINKPSLILTNRFTISLWFKPSNLTQTSKYLLGKGDGYAVLWEYVNNIVEFYSVFTGTDPRTGSAMVIPDTNWHHVAYTYDGVTQKGYVDSNLIFSIGKIFSLADGGTNLTIGSHISDTTTRFNGNIDGVRICNVAISASEIKQQFQAEAWKYGIAS